MARAATVSLQLWVSMMAQIPAMLSSSGAIWRATAETMGRDLVRLIDAPGESPAGATVKEGERQPQDVPEGGLDQVRLDGAGHRGTLQVGGQGEEVADHADAKEQGDRPQQGSQGLSLIHI